MAAVKYFSASRNSSCLLQLQASGFEEAKKKLNEKGINVVLEINGEPRTSLAQTYNQVLDADDAKSFDWIVLVHSDAAMDVENFTNTLLSLSDKYDAVGVAGAKKLNLAASPLSWFTASKDSPESRIGIVTHVGPVGAKQASIGTMYAPPDVTDTYVAAVDGVCIAVGRKVIDNKDCRFDERFPFDFYDMDFSFTVNTLGLALGAVVEKSFVHLSGGKGILKPKYGEIEKVFRNKWNI